MTRVALLCLTLAACRPHGGFVSQPGGPTPGPQPAPDTRNEGQMIVDLLTGGGYTCNVEETRWQCQSGTVTWPLYISYLATDNPVTIWFDSYQNRAFARPCANFTDAMKDLANNTDFIVSCDDTTQQFRFNTYFSYAAGLDVTQLLAHHDEQRQNAVKLLDSVQAIRH